MNLRRAYHPTGDCTEKVLATTFNLRFSMTTAMLNSAVKTAVVRYGEMINEKPTDGVDVRLGISDKSGTNSVQHLDSGLNLAELRPALLVSYVYLDRFLRHRNLYRYRNWVLDSGAFSAYNSGVVISLDKYADTIKQLADEPDPPVEVYSLDVIGDWRASLKNTERLWKMGIPAIPCYHVGEPEHVLKGLAKDFPKIALGGAVVYRHKYKWAQQCFARVYPKPIHGFGFCSTEAVMGLPWHSVDATNWELKPCCFGRWESFGGSHLRIRGSKQNLRSEIEHYLRLEHKARQVWAREYEKMNCDGLDLRLGMVSEAVNRFDSFRKDKVTNANMET
jgi:hypothetical protein